MTRSTRFSHGRIKTNIRDYLPNKKQRIEVNDAYNSWKDITHGVPQGFILGLLLFNIHLFDLFYFLEDLDTVNYADDSTIYKVNEKEECTRNIFITDLWIVS